MALGRRFRALKLWFVMRYFGRNRIADILRENVRMAAWLAEQVGADSRFEMMASANMGLVCFRLRDGDDATRDFMARLNRSGEIFVSHTVLAERFTIRVPIGNIRTRQQDVEDVVDSDS